MPKDSLPAEMKSYRPSPFERWAIAQLTEINNKLDRMIITVIVNPCPPVPVPDTKPPTPPAVIVGPGDKVS